MITKIVGSFSQTQLSVQPRDWALIPIKGEKKKKCEVLIGLFLLKIPFLNKF